MATTAILQESPLGREVRGTLEEGLALPFSAIQEAIQYMRYATPDRVMFLMAYYSGCRIAELSSMRSRDIVKTHEGFFVQWWCGKNQNAVRKSPLPQKYIQELQTYRNQCRVPREKLFSKSGDSFVRSFNKHTRPLLGAEWNDKVQKEIRPKTGVILFPEVHAYQIKGLRKTYATFYFFKAFQKHGSLTWALELTSKHMRHKNNRVTAYHYIQHEDVVKDHLHKELWDLV